MDVQRQGSIAEFYIQPILLSIISFLIIKEIFSHQTLESTYFKQFVCVIHLFQKNVKYRKWFITNIWICI